MLGVFCPRTSPVGLAKICPSASGHAVEHLFDPKWSGADVGGLVA